MGGDTSTPGAAALDAASVYDALQLVVAGLACRAGDRPAAVHLAREDRLVAIAAAGMDDSDRNALLDAPWPLTQVRASAPLDGSGRVQLWVDARLAPVPTSPPVSPPPRPGAGTSPRGGVLVAPVHDARGHLRGTVMVEVEPGIGSEERRSLDQDAARAAAAVRAGIEHQELVERLRLSEATHRIARVAAVGTALDEVMRQTADDIVRLFGLVGLRARVATPGLPLVQTAYAGPWPADPEWLEPMIDDFAARYWDRQRIAITSTEQIDPSDPPEVDRFREYLRQIGWSSSALVPLGAGSECFGSLALVRAAGAPAWTGAEAAAAFEIGLDLGRVLASTRALERERRLVCDLQAVDAYKNRLIGTVSHELRNPLAAIRANLELLSDGDLDHAGRHAVEVTQRWAGRMARVVDDLLHLARTLDDRAAAGNERVELGGVVYDAAELLAEEARHRGVPVAVDLPDAPAHVLGDLDLLGQIALNLISNAIKYSAKGGPVRAGVRVDDAEAQLVVVDRGIGISQEDQRRLFTEFFRSADPAVHAQPGTGLGLAIVDRLVRRLGGRIHVESELGSGTTVRVWFPLAPQPPGGHGP